MIAAILKRRVTMTMPKYQHHLSRISFGFIKDNSLAVIAEGYSFHEILSSGHVQKHT